MTVEYNRLFDSRMTLIFKHMDAFLGVDFFASILGITAATVRDTQKFGAFMNDAGAKHYAPLGIASEFSTNVLELPNSTESFDKLAVIEMDTLLAVLESDAACVITMAGIIYLATNGYFRGKEYINEIGICPNGNPNCDVNAFADAVFVRSREIAAAHGVEFTNLAIEQHRWNNSDEVRIWVGKQLLKSISFKRIANA